jgi:CDP-diacylglycerol--glycerol-3-phosphate 3-phosphatidyltransferase
MGGNYKIVLPDTASFPIFETISIFTVPVTVMAFLANWTAIGRLRDARRTLDARAKAAAGNGNGVAAGREVIEAGNGTVQPGKEVARSGSSAV